MVPQKLVYLSINGVLAIFLTACGALDAIPIPEGNSENSLVNTRWRLVSYGQPGSETSVIEGSGLTLEFEEDSQAGGSAGCNTFGAEYEVSAGNHLSMSEIVSTLMACNDEAFMEQETQYLDALRSAESFELSNENLTIRYQGGVLNFSRVASRIPGTVHL